MSQVGHYFQVSYRNLCKRYYLFDKMCCEIEKFQRNQQLTYEDSFSAESFQYKKTRVPSFFLICVYKDINFTFLDFQRFSYIFSGNKSSNQYYHSKMRQLSEGRKTLGDGLEICGKKCNKYHRTTSKTNPPYKLQWRITGK